MRKPSRQRNTEAYLAPGWRRGNSRKPGKSLRLISLIFSLLLIFLSYFTAFAADNHYYIDELNLNIDLPGEMLAITRESPETNKYFSLFGLDYESTMSDFENNNIYLQGMYEDSSGIFTVTAVSDENSKSVGNYNTLSDDQLIEVEESFLKEDEYSSCTIQRYNNYIFMSLQFQTETDGQTVNAQQCNTVVNGNNITLTMQPSKDSELTTADYKVMNDIIGSIVFADQNTETPLSIVEKPEFWYCVIIGVVVIAVIIVVIFAVKKKKGGKKSRQAEKKLKNQELLQELAKEFVSGSVHSGGEDPSVQNVKQVIVSDVTAEEADGETAEQIIRQFRSSEDYEKIRRKSHGETEPQLRPEEITSEQQEDSAYSEDDPSPQTGEKEASAPLNVRKEPSLKIVTPEDDSPFDEEPEGYDGEESDGVYYEDEYEYDREEQDYYEEDGQVIASENSFRQSGDYFDEAPDDEAYSLSGLDGREGYPDKKRQKLEKREKNKGNAGDNLKTAGAVALNGILIFLNGAKSFFIHLGYFVTNLTRLIKRKHKINKRKKAEAQKRRRQEEALRRKRENQIRKQQKQGVKDVSGLVKVHSQAPGRNGSGKKRY